MLRSCLSFVLLFSLSTGAVAAEQSAKLQPPLSPEESLRWFELDEGLRIEIAAAEPEVVDPVAVRFDEDGRMWVAEYRDYPNGPAEGAKPLSRIKLLEDRDGDGRYETAHLFAENLPFCNGIQPWNGGVIATMAGRVAFLKDTDGDHRADVNETWYSGFAEENPQLRVNHPRFALDNHVYVANGMRGGEVVNPRDPKSRPVPLRANDLRFDPRTGAYEAVAGKGQFGLTFDDFGNRFLCSNRNPLFHVVFEERYLAKNKNYVVPTVVYDVAAAGEASRVYPIVEAWTTSILHAGQFTAACGVDIYRGNALPAAYYGNSFTCEPTGSLVHREVLTPDGPTFQGRSPYESREFLASRDPWCRPVYCDGGPDGALYVCDMYRAVIEHPQFMPAELKDRPDLRHGEDRGRIYRVVGREFRRPAPTSLSAATNAELVALFDHPNAWQRETAQRLLIERKATDAVDALRKSAQQGRTPQGRVHALWTLVGLDAVDAPTLCGLLQDADDRVRTQALVVAETRLSDATIAAAAEAGVEGAKGRLLFQALLSLQPDDSTRKIKRLADAASGASVDPWLRRTILLSVGGDAGAVLVDLVQRPVPATAEAAATRAEMIRELAAYAATLSDRAPLNQAVASVYDDRDGPRGKSYLMPLLWGLSKGLKENLSDVAGPAWVEWAVEHAKNETYETALRCDACDLLAYAPFAAADETLRPLFADGDLDVRSRAIAALAAHRNPQVAAILLEAYPKQSPRFRTQILDAMLSRSERVGPLLDAIEAKKFKATDLDTTRTARLLKSSDSKLKARIEKLLAASIPADRTKALADYQRVLTMTADARRGKEVFKKNCATCHKVGDLGNEVGPSIADLRTKTPEQVLLDVIQPNKAIDNNFVSYTVVTTDGLTYVGLVASDTPAGVTLKLPEGKTVSILRKDIDVMESNGKSLMPEGIEKNIPYQEMADVIAFVKNWRYLDGAVPGLGESK